MISRVWKSLWNGSRRAAVQPRFVVRRSGWSGLWSIRQVETLEVRLLLSGTDVSAPDYNFGWYAATDSDSHDDHDAHESEAPFSGGGPLDPPPGGSGGSDGPGDAPNSGAGSPNLKISSAFLIDADGNPISAPVTGQMVYLQANWSTTDLAISDDYVVSFTVDGVNLDSSSISGLPGTNLAYFWRIGGWYASPGTHNVVVRVDGGFDVTETNEGDNAVAFSFTTEDPDTLPQKFSSPIGGSPLTDWTIVNYIDVDPRVGIAKDYKGGAYQYDQHNGWDISLPNFERMDSGITVIAAADGVVVATQDGLFDRENTSGARDWNFVTIDHGDGWTTTYGHLATDTISVVPGQTVTRGQILGFVGSSGNSTGPHLHFVVQHDGAVVETGYDSGAYWTTPLTYQGDLAPTILDFGTTNYDMFASPPDDWKERPASKTTFSRSTDADDTHYFWFEFSQMRTTDLFSYRLIRPDGFTAFSDSRISPTLVRGSAYAWYTLGSWQTQVGVWRSELRVNGVLVATSEVTVTDGTAPAELSVRDGGALVLDDRTTAIDVATTKTFTLQNYGSSPLSISRIDVPTGFAVVGGAPTTIAAGASVGLTIQFTGSAPDIYQGDVVIRSSDVDNASYAFRIRHEIVGPPSTGAPIVDFEYHSIVEMPAGSFTTIDPNATFTDSDFPSNGLGYTLNVDIVSGVFANDAIKVANGGLYTTSGTNLLRSGTAIARYTTSSATSIALLFNASATQADIQNVLRLLAFNAGGGPLSSGQRIIRTSVTDNTNKRSKYAYRTAIVPPFVNSAPVVPTQTIFVPENSPNGSVVGTVDATEKDAGQSLTYAIVSGNSNGVFTLDPATGDVIVADVTALNFEVTKTFTFVVRVTDDGFPSLSTTATVTIQLTNVNEAPTSIQPNIFTVDENVPIGTIVANLSSNDPDFGDTGTYSLVPGIGSADNDLFTIVGAELQVNANLDYEEATNRQIRIRVTDAGGLAFEKAVIVNIINLNDPPKLALQNLTTALFDNVSTTSSIHLADIVITDDPLGTHPLILNGVDEGFFEIVGTTLRLKAGTRLNSDLKSTYFVKVQVNDPTIGGNPDDSVDFLLTINDPPVEVFLDDTTTSVVENSSTASALKVADISVKDPGTGTTVLSLGGVDAAFFEIVGTELQLRAGTVLDFETKTSYTVTVQADNSTVAGDVDAVATLTLNVVNVNEVPTLSLQNLTSTLPENTASPAKVADVVITDDALGFNQLSLTGPDADAFEIVSNVLRFKSSTVLNFESQSVYHVTVRMDDAAVGATPDGSIDVVVTLTDVNEPPVITLQNVVATLPEDFDTTTSHKVADILVTDDALGDYVLSLAGDGSTQFEIVGTELRLKAGAVLNYEAKSSYSIQVNADDATIEGAVDASTTYQLTLTDVNEAPTNLALSATTVTENGPAGVSVGIITVTDPDADNTFTYSFVDGEGSADNGSFTIIGNSLKITSSPNYEAKPNYSIRLRAVDQGGLAIEKSFTITVIDSNELPTNIQLSASTVPENVAVGTIVGTFSTTDPDLGGTHRYSLVNGPGGANNSAFSIVDGKLVTAVELNFETQSSYSIRVRTTDQGNLTFEKQFVITVSDLEEAPTDITLSSSSILENLAAGTTVGTLLTADSDLNETFTYTLVDGEGSADNSAFVIVNGQLQTTASFDMETQSSYSIRVQSTDSTGLSLQKQLTITVVNVNEAPTNLVLSGDSVSENLSSSVVIGTFSGSDVDFGTNLTYSLVSGPGSTDNAGFTIIDNRLWNVAKFDRETQSSLAIRVRVTDQDGLSLDKEFTISVTNVNEAPTGLNLSAASFPENAPTGTTIGLFTAIDPDVGNTFTYSLVDGEGSIDNDSFAIVQNQLRTNAIFDFETRNSYSIRVRTQDQDGLSFERQITISVNDVNEDLTQITLSSSTIVENSPIGSSIGTFDSTDPDADSEFTYELVNGDGGEDNASFAIVNGTLRTATSFDFETKNSYSILVRATDQGGLVLEQSFTITITNGNDAPTISSIATQTISEDTATGLLAFSVADLESPAENLTVSVSSSNGDLVPDANLTLAGTGANRTVRVTPLPDRFGVTTITLVVSDGVTSTSTTFDVNVLPVNDGPTMTGFAPQTILEDSPTNPLAFTVGDIDTPLNDLTITITSSDTNLVPIGNVVVTGSGANRTLVATPAANQNGIATITVIVGDGDQTTSRSFVLTVQPVDDPAVVTLSPEPLLYQISSRKAATIDSTVTVTSVDAQVLQFNGAVLIVSGQSSRDSITILKQNGISLKGKKVFFGTTQIGTLTGGTRGLPLGVTFNAAATQESVETLARNVGFKAARKTEGNRTLHFQITNVGGRNTLPVAKQVEVST